MINAIASSRPALGGLAVGISPSAVIVPANADKPYILGAGVLKVLATASKTATEATIGATATGELKGVMCMGQPQIAQRDNFVREGFSEAPNQLGTQGVFWCPLDLSTFDATTLTSEAKLYCDPNGVFHYAVTAPTATDNGSAPVEVTGAVVLNYYSSAIISSLDETIAIGANSYAFKYTSGIGAILLNIK